MMNNQTIDPSKIAWFGRYNIPGILNSRNTCILVKLVKEITVGNSKYSHLMLNKAYLNSDKCPDRAELITAAEEMRLGNVQSATKSYEKEQRVTEVGKQGDWWMSFDNLKASLPKESKIPGELTALLGTLVVKKNRTIEGLLSSVSEDESSDH